MDTFENELKQSSHIFTGIVTGVEEYYVETGNYTEKYHCTTFQVYDIYKGENLCGISIFTEPDEASCGFNFTLDSTYLVYAHYDYYGVPELKKSLSTGYCTRTGEMSHRKNDISKLNKLGKSIYQLSDISPEKLYGQIWEDEFFIVTDTNPEPCLSSEEIRERMLNQLIYCQSDSIFPEDKYDSLQLKNGNWDFIINHVEIDVTIDKFGNAIHFEKAYGRMNNEECVKLASNFIKGLGQWIPGTINDQPVKTFDYYSIDFSEIKSR